MEIAPQQTQTQVKQLKPLTKEEIARLNKRKFEAENTSEKKISEEHLLICELGMMYGFSAVMAVLDDEIDIETVNWLVLGGRKLQAKMYYNNVISTAKGVGCAMSKDTNAIKKATSEYQKEMEL